MPDWIFDSPSFDVLDAALYTYLPGLAAGGVSFKREQIMRGLVVYHLSKKELGDLGSIMLRMLPKEHTELAITPPPKPAREKIEPKGQEELLQIEKEQRALLREAQRRRTNHLARVIEEVFHWIDSDLSAVGETSLFGDSPKAQQRAGRLFKRDRLEERAEEAHRLMQEEGKTQSEAIEEARSSHKSLKRWLAAQEDDEPDES